MASNTEKQPKAKSKKRRRIITSETDSSDECDSLIVKTQRKQRINRVKNEIKILSRKDRELQAAGSSQNVECEMNPERANGKTPSASNAVLARSMLDSGVPDAAKALNKVETGFIATGSKGEVNVENNDDNKSSDQCPICWIPFTNQEVGIPICCEHCFCLQCLIEWSKNTNNCPVDRRIFTMIEVRESPGGIVTRSIPVETRNIDRENESGQEPNSSYHRDLFSSSDEGRNSWDEINHSPDPFPSYESDEGRNSSLTNDTGDSWPPQENNDHSTDDDQMRFPTWPYDDEPNSSPNQQNDENNSSPNQENDESNSSSNQEDEAKNYSSNQDDEEKNYSSNQDEEKNYSSNGGRNYSSNQDEDNDDDERNLSSNQDDAESNFFSNQSDWQSSQNIDYNSTPDRINSSMSNENNSDRDTRYTPDIRYSPSSVSQTSNRSYSTSLTNLYSSALDEQSDSSPDYFHPQSPSTFSDSGTSYSS